VTSSPPGVTMVIACYNHAPYVADALAAAFAQDYPNLTVMVTDDASSDDTQAVVRRVLEENGWTARLLFHERNVGVCRTFNEVLELIDTPYVCFPSGDDWSVPERISTQVAALEAAGPTCALAYCDAIEVNSAGEPLGRRFSDVVPKAWARRRDGVLYQTLLRGNWIPAISVLARADRLREVGGFDPDLAFEDYDMWLRLAAAGHGFTSTDEPLVYLRRHSDNLMKHLRADKGERLLKNRLAIYAKQIGVDPSMDGFIERKTFGYIDQAFLAGMAPERVSPLYRAHAETWNNARSRRLAALTRLRVPGGAVAAGREFGKVTAASLSRARKLARKGVRRARRKLDALRSGSGH
jgi:glycosyltransferase involved in cell wall biosynthesis